MNAKKFAASFVAATMLATMMATGVSATDATDWGENVVDEDNQVTDAIISFVVPSNLEFAIDAFQKGDESGSQVFSTGFEIINKSDVPVQATVKAKLTPKAGADVVIAKTADAALPVDASDTEKRIYMEMVSATKMTVDAETPGTVSTDGTTGNTPGTVSFKDPTFGDGTFKTSGSALGAQGAAKATLDVENAVMAFALKEADYINSGLTADADAGKNMFNKVAHDTTDATKILGAATFRFMGSVNPYAVWAAQDVQVNAVFDVRGMTKTMYTDTVAASKITNGLNLVTCKSASKAPGRVGNDAIVLPKATGGSDVDIVLDLGMGEDGADGIKGIKVYPAGSTTGTALTAAQFAFNADTNTLTLKAAGYTNYAKGTTLEITFSKAGVTSYAQTLRIAYTTN